jgi:hypothetical protein
MRPCAQPLSGRRHDLLERRERAGIVLGLERLPVPPPLTAHFTLSTRDSTTASFFRARVAAARETG